ncbi:unnamed protein product [Microthlaspi erraticum]|uniref:Uncharacterized protein n=1 Tax=Microthlaspi erraticum TaxID=1685480 RepID=A0A6D2JML3_9BRAS|nr:unnamed protein product [Microthlaspi erraticum]
MVRNKTNVVRKKKKTCPADDEPEYIRTQQPEVHGQETQQVDDDDPMEDAPLLISGTGGVQDDDGENEEDPEGELAGEVPEVPVRKRQRGPTRMKKLAKHPNNRERVEFNAMREPIGPGSVKLSSYLGPLVREHVPVTLGDWRKISEELKTVLWKSIQLFKPLNNATNHNRPLPQTPHPQPQPQRLNQSGP